MNSKTNNGTYVTPDEAGVAMAKYEVNVFRETILASFKHSGKDYVLTVYIRNFSKTASRIKVSLSHEGRDEGSGLINEEWSLHSYSESLRGLRFAIEAITFCAVNSPR